ncbi:hypothetical protein [Rubrimonas cliftonensis]|uniref:hypothetical protein n=1 Tax=Rubrimonas cliftonensis TaxID=89524 RepID=UPI0015873D41|nr:hypothetical protein [Rubrimonas cliftonensis]
MVGEMTGAAAREAPERDHGWSTEKPERGDARIACGDRLDGGGFDHPRRRRRLPPPS